MHSLLVIVRSRSNVIFLPFSQKESPKKLLQNSWKIKQAVQILKQDKGEKKSQKIQKETRLGQQCGLFFIITATRINQLDTKWQCCSFSKDSSLVKPQTREPITPNECSHVRKTHTKTYTSLTLPKLKSNKLAQMDFQK